MEIEAAGTLERAEHTAWRPIAVSAIGPLTALAGVVWAFAQPYRLAIVNDGRTGWWDHLVQPPLLVVAVGVFFTVAVAGSLTRALRDGR